MHELQLGTLGFILHPGRGRVGSRQHASAHHSAKPACMGREAWEAEVACVSHWLQGSQGRLWWRRQQWWAPAKTRQGARQLQTHRRAVFNGLQL